MMNFKEMLNDEFELQQWVEQSLFVDDKRTELHKVSDFGNGEYQLTIKIRDLSTDELKNRDFLSAAGRIKPKRIKLCEIW